jgi:hypothetical protein
MKYRSFLFWVLALSLLCPFSGCSGGQMTARERLDTVLSLCPATPVGQVYDSTAAVWEKDNLPQTISDNLYQSGDGRSAFSLSDECALFLASGFSGGEAAVFVASDRGAREVILRICAERLSSLRRAFPEAEAGVLFERGDAVILLFLPGSEEIRRAL